MMAGHFSCIVLLLSLAAMVAADLSVDRNCVYTLFVKTGDIEKAGTDSKITAILGDHHGESFKISNLEKWGLMRKEHDYFERGNLDIFGRIRSKCLDLPVCKLQLISDVKGRSPGWYIESIEVTVTMPHETCSQTTFPINQWLGVDSSELIIRVDKCKKNVA